MDDETEERILDKARHVQQAVATLSRKQSLPEETYRDDREERAIVEREFQTAIEACIDVATLVLKAAGRSVPETNAARFETLAELDAFSDEVCRQMSEAAGFRNVLAHNYGQDIDDELIYRHLQQNLEWFPAFLEEVRTHLRSDDAETES
jgi:uncharacterized protein YutE (UPF0331/DUF86 family)